MTINEIESLAKKIQKQFADDGEPVTIEEAREIATLELKSRGLARVMSENEQGKKKPKPRKVDTTKEKLLKRIMTLLEEMGATDCSTETETALSFTYELDNYTIRLVKHRAKKGA